MKRDPLWSGAPEESGRVTELSTTGRIRLTLKRRVTAAIGGKEMGTEADGGAVSLRAMGEGLEGFPGG